MEFVVGDTINHARFGVGSIESISSDNPPWLKVNFDGTVHILQLDDSLRTQLRQLPIESDDDAEVTVAKEIEDPIRPEFVSKDVILDAQNPPKYRTMRDAISNTIGKNLGDWRQACWPSRSGNDNFRIWFPHLAETKNGILVPTANGCVNTLSDDWNTLIYEDLKPDSDEFEFKGIINLIFAKEPYNGPYVFRGIYELDVDGSSDNHYVYKRIGKRVRMIGRPAYDIEITDDLTSPDTGINESDDGNLAFKCNYCDGGKSADHIGYYGICSDDVRKYNIEIEKRAWCTNPNCPCYQYYIHRISKEQLKEIMSNQSEIVCYESTMLSEWRTQAGLTRNGKPKTFGATLHKDAVGVYTTRLPGMRERDRFVFGLFIIDELSHGNDLESGYVKCNTKYHIELKPNEAKRIKFWNFHRNKNIPEDENWRQGLVRKLSNQEILNILKAIAAIRDNDDKQEVIDFLAEFCRLNNLKSPDILTESEDKSIVSFPSGSTYDVVLETGVHAHPLKKGFPSKVSKYLMVRATGGVSEAVYEVIDHVDLNPLDKVAIKSLTPEQKCIEAYINKRMSTYGFKYAPIPYRFYILRTIYSFEDPYVMNPNPQSHTYLSFSDLNINADQVIEHNDSSALINDYDRRRIELDDQSIEEDVNQHALEGMERVAVVKARVNQSVFRDVLIRKYHKCCLCGADEESLLIASHIKPWADSTRKERVDENNGLLLCPNHDRLFDRGYISFDDKGKILISSDLNEINCKSFNVDADMTIEMSPKTKEFMEYHRNCIFEKHR